jgi:hypothetical protein
MAQDAATAPRPLRLRAIGCDILSRPIHHCAARSRHAVDVVFLRRGLHTEPPTLRGRLQAEIDSTGPEYDAVVLAYGLCGGATAGLRAGRIPVVLPRAHDCITLFLGGRERYDAQFADEPPTYWYVQDQLERDDGSAPAVLGAGADSDEALRATYETYLQRYGRDNADYLMETLGQWRSHYGRAAFVDMGIADATAAQARARAEAERRGWRFERLAGDLDLIRRLLDGDWEDDFLVLQPGERLAMSYDAGVVRAVGPSDGAGPADSERPYSPARATGRSASRPDRYAPR